MQCMFLALVLCQSRCLLLLFTDRPNITLLLNDHMVYSQLRKCLNLMIYCNTAFFLKVVWLIIICLAICFSQVYERALIMTSATNVKLVSMTSTCLYC